VTETILRHPNAEQTPISIHVLPADLEPERAIELLERYCQAIDAGQHPPFRYIAGIFAEIDALLNRCEEGDS
jgi:hypothetical protein